MVFFICDGCGETLKKNKVDAHAAKCRECWSVSCVDCSQSFPGDEYRLHTSCISEAERYEKTIFRGTRKLDESGTGHRQQQQRGKKLTPQEAWQQTIEIAAESAPSNIKSYMDQLTTLDNVPRKEKQFRNFTVNSLRLKGPSAERIKDEIWKHLSEVRDEERQKKEEAQKKQQSSQSAKESKKEAPSSVSDDDKSNNNTKEGKSSPASSMPTEKEVTKAVKKALKKAPNKSLKFKALRKTVQEALVIKIKSDSAKKEWKKLLNHCVDTNSKKFIVDGKVISLKD